MYVSLVRANSGWCDVVIFFQHCAVFASALGGTRYIQQAAERGEVPFATMSIPRDLGNPVLLSRIAGYEHSDLNVFSDRFVLRGSTVCAAGYDAPERTLPTTQFWRAVSALYCSALGQDLREW